MRPWASTHTYPKFPFVYFFDTTVFRHRPFTTETYEHVIAQVPRDGTPMLKLWLLAAHGTVDETMPQRKRAGCAIERFCQRCVEVRLTGAEDIYCTGCSEWVLEEGQPGRDELADWGEAQDAEREHRHFGLEPGEADSDDNPPGHD